MICKLEKENKYSRKHKLQNDFWPEYVEEISFVYLVNQIFEPVSDLFVK